MVLFRRAHLHLALAIGLFVAAIATGLLAVALLSEAATGQRVANPIVLLEVGLASVLVSVLAWLSGVFFWKRREFRSFVRLGRW